MTAFRTRPSGGVSSSFSLDVLLPFAWQLCSTHLQIWIAYEKANNGPARMKLSKYGTQTGLQTVPNYPGKATGLAGLGGSDAGIARKQTNVQGKRAQTNNTLQHLHHVWCLNTPTR